MGNIAKDSEGKFSLQLVLAKLENDGESISTFHLLDYGEIVPFSRLENKLTKFYNTGIEKIKEIAEELLNSKKLQLNI